MSFRPPRKKKKTWAACVIIRCHARLCFAQPCKSTVDSAAAAVRVRHSPPCSLETFFGSLFRLTVNGARGVTATWNYGARACARTDSSSVSRFRLAGWLAARSKPHCDTDTALAGRGLSSSSIYVQPSGKQSLKQRGAAGRGQRVVCLHCGN